MSHVTTFWFKAKPGKRQEVIDMFRGPNMERVRKVKGFERAVLIADNDDPDQFLAVARFDSTESYNANSNSPEQDAWFKQLRALIQEDPGWFNGTLENESVP